MKKLPFFDKIIFFINSVIALITAVSLLVPYVSVASISSLSTVSLIVPLLVYVNIGFVIYWLLRRNRRAFLSSFLLVLWYLVLGPFYQFSGKNEDTASDTLSVMSFNVRSFNKYDWIKNPKLEEEIHSLIKSQDPDVLCFQEFSMIKKRKFNDYPYNYETPGGTNKSYQIIFSKHPIVHGASLKFPKTINNGIYVDVAYAQDTIRIYNVHLQSFRIIPEIDAIKKEKSSKLLAKSGRVMLKQDEQAKLIKKNKEKNHYKQIVVGDFNNTQYSSVYRTIKGNMKDTFLEKGKGFGRTYNLLGFPIRIDYILADPAFEVISHQNFNERLSDHYPVMATLRLKPE